MELLNITFGLLLIIVKQWSFFRTCFQETITDDWSFSGVLLANMILMSTNNLIPATIHVNGLWPLQHVIESTIAFVLFAFGINVWMAIAQFINTMTSLMLFEPLSSSAAILIRLALASLYLLGTLVGTGSIARMIQFIIVWLRRIGAPAFAIPRAPRARMYIR